MPVRVIPSANSPSAEPRHVAEARERLVGGGPPPDQGALEALDEEMGEVFAAFAAERGISRPPRRKP